MRDEQLRDEGDEQRRTINDTVSSTAVRAPLQVLISKPISRLPDTGYLDPSTLRLAQRRASTSSSGSYSESITSTEWNRQINEVRARTLAPGG